MSKEPIQEITISSFDDLEHHLLDFRKNRRHYQLFYRGQSESIWGLVPSIFRNFNKDEIPFDSIKSSIRSEYSGVLYFVRYADKLGFHLPGDLLEFLNPDKFKINELRNFNHWYVTTENKWIELTTIAQHYGVSTRYLDFSFDPYTALFFAAVEVTKKLLDENEPINESNNYFSLWVVDRFYIDLPDCNIIKYEVPTARNKYLNAQKGLFLSPPLPPLRRRIKNVPVSSLDIAEVAIKNNYEIVKNGKTGLQRRWPSIYKFNFPFDSAPQILQDLDYKHGINTVTLKPNLEHIMLQKEFSEKVNNMANKLRDKK